MISSQTSKKTTSVSPMLDVKADSFERDEKKQQQLSSPSISKLHTKIEQTKNSFNFIKFYLDRKTVTLSHNVIIAESMTNLSISSASPSQNNSPINSTDALNDAQFEGIIQPREYHLSTPQGNRFKRIKMVQPPFLAFIFVHFSWKNWFIK